MDILESARTNVQTTNGMIRPSTFRVVAGPCTVESYEQYAASAKAVKEAGFEYVRGGAFKPRTSPYSFQGLGEEGLRIMSEVNDELGLKGVTEVMDPDHIEPVMEHAQIIQIGARNMANFSLLKRVGAAIKGTDHGVVLIPRSHKITLSPPSDVTYSAASSHSSTVAEKPRFKTTPWSVPFIAAPTRFRREKFALLRAPIWMIWACSMTGSMWSGSITSVTPLRPSSSLTSDMILNPSSPRPWKE